MPRSTRALADPTVQRRVLRRAIVAFKKEVLNADHAEHRALGLRGIVEDEKNGRDRVVIFHAPKADLRALRKLAKEHFGDHLFKLVPLARKGRGTNVQSGDQIAHDDSGPGTVGGWLKKKG